MTRVPSEVRACLTQSIDAQYRDDSEVPFSNQREMWEHRVTLGMTRISSEVRACSAPLIGARTARPPTAMRMFFACERKQTPRHVSEPLAVLLVLSALSPLKA